MKKINFLLSILFMIVTFFTPEMARFIKAEVKPFALVTTIKDQESNNTFSTAVIIEDTETNVASPNYKNSYIGGIISSASDVDYFCLNSFSTGTMLLQLTMLDTSFESTYNYNFEIYEHVNTTNSSKTSSYMTLLYSSNTVGTNEYYRFNCKATSYFIKIYSTSGSSSRNSYQLSYSVYRQKTSYDLAQYVSENSEGYALWESDFKYGGVQNVVFPCDQENYITYTLDNDSIYHDVTKKFFEYGEYPVLELYFWGVETRQRISNFVGQIISRLQESVNEINNVNNRIEIITNINKTVEDLLFVIGLVDSLGSTILTLSFEVADMLLAFFGVNMIPLEAENYESLIDDLENLQYAIYNSQISSGDDDIVFAITFKNKLIKKYASGNYNYFNNCLFDSTGSRYNSMYRYESNTIYDSKQFDNNNDGIYNYIYGKCYFDNIENRLNAFYFG